MLPFWVRSCNLTVVWVSRCDEKNPVSSLYLFLKANTYTQIKHELHSVYVKKCLVALLGQKLFRPPSYMQVPHIFACTQITCTHMTYCIIMFFQLITNAYIKNIILKFMEYYKVRQYTTQYIIAKLPYLVPKIVSMKEDDQISNILEYTLFCILLIEEVYKSTEEKHPQGSCVEPSLCSKEEIQVLSEMLILLINCSDIIVSHLAKICFEFVKRFHCN